MKSRFVLMAMIGCAVAFGALGGNALYAAAETAAVTPANFAKKVVFTVSGYQGASSLENFPLLVRVSPTLVKDFDYADCGEGGSDSIRFTDSSGKPYAFEIDTWNTSGESVFWVSIPTLSGKATTIIMYYGGTGADEPKGGSAQSVWTSAGYIGVWHMTPDAVNKIDPESSHGYNAAFGALATPSTARAVIGGSHYLNGNNAPVAPANSDFSALKGDVTVDLWAWSTKQATSRHWGGLLNTKNAGFNTGNADSDLEIRDTADVVGTIPSFYNAWRHVVISWDSETGNRTTYVDAAAQGSPLTKGGASYTAFNNTSVCIGGRASANTVWNGYLDEVRLRKLPTTADWAAAEYLNATSAGFVGNAGASDAVASTLEFGLVAAQEVLPESAVVGYTILSCGRNGCSVKMEVADNADFANPTETALGTYTTAGESKTVTLTELEIERTYYMRLTASAEGYDDVVSDTVVFTTAGAGVIYDDISMTYTSPNDPKFTVKAQKLGAGENRFELRMALTVVGLDDADAVRTEVAVSDLLATTITSSWIAFDTTVYYRVDLVNEYKGHSWASPSRVFSTSPVNGGTFTWNAAVPAACWTNGAAWTRGSAPTGAAYPTSSSTLAIAKDTVAEIAMDGDQSVKVINPKNGSGSSVRFIGDGDDKLTLGAFFFSRTGGYSFAFDGVAVDYKVSASENFCDQLGANVQLVFTNGASFVASGTYPFCFYGENSGLFLYDGSSFTFGSSGNPFRLSGAGTQLVIDGSTATFDYLMVNGSAALGTGGETRLVFRGAVPKLTVNKRLGIDAAQPTTVEFDVPSTGYAAAPITGGASADPLMKTGAYDKGTLTVLVAKSCPAHDATRKFSTQLIDWPAGINTNAVSLSVAERIGTARWEGDKNGLPTQLWLDVRRAPGFAIILR